MGQQGFWDFEVRHQKLAEKKDLLIWLDESIPWEAFRPMIESVYAKPRKSNAGGRNRCSSPLSKEAEIVVSWRL